MRFDVLLCQPRFRAVALALLSLLLGGVGQAEERLWLEATINGKPAHLAFDTGTTGLILFPRAVARLGLAFTNAPEDFELAPGEAPKGRTEECDLKIGATSVRTSFGYFEIPKMLDRVTDGVVGWRPVRENIVMVDASRGTVNCLAEAPGDVTNWIEFRLQTNSSVLLLEIPSGSGSQSNMAVDTGYDGGVKLSPNRWRVWKAAHADQPMTLEGYYTPQAGTVVSEQAWSEQLAIGPLQITEVVVTEADRADVALGQGYEATLGLAALKRLDLVIDGKRGIAYLRAKDTPPADYQYNRSGAVFVPRDLQSADLIGYVVEGSPAWEAGIRNGDVLTRIADLDVTRWRTDPAVLPLARFWTRPPGTKLELTLRRGKKVFEAEIVLRQILSPKKGPSLQVQHE
jgi:hypothetical protein